MSKIIRMKADLIHAPIKVCPERVLWQVFRAFLTYGGSPVWGIWDVFRNEKEAVATAMKFPITCIVEINLPEIEVPSQ